MADHASATRVPNSKDTPSEISSDTETTGTPSPPPFVVTSPIHDPYYPEGLTPPIFKPTYVPSDEGTSRAPPVYRGARITVRPPPPSSLLGMGHASKRARYAETGNWNWMPKKLAEWRFMGNLESAPNFGLSTGFTPSIALTQEPIHLTIPTLVSQLSYVERRVDRIEPLLASTPGMGEIHARMIRMERETERCLARNRENQELIHELHKELKMVKDEAEDYKFELHVTDMAVDACNNRIEELERKVEAHEQIVMGLRAALNDHNKG